MASTNLFHRYIWLVDTIYSAGKITKEEIDRRWAVCPYNEDKEEEYLDRSFHRHKNAIEEMFGIEIRCDKSRQNTYYISRDYPGSDNRDWLMNGFALNNVMQIAPSLRRRFQFDEMPPSAKYLSTIAEAMHTNKQMSITFKAEESHKGYLQAIEQPCVAEPYLLRQKAQDWYLVCRVKEYQQPITLPVNDITSIEILSKEWKLPKRFDAAKYFADYVGMNCDPTLPTEEILIRTVSPLTEQLEAHPLHVSQQLVEAGEGYAIYSYRVAVTKELQDLVRLCGPQATVQAPEKLRNMIMSDVAVYNEQYSKKSQRALQLSLF